MRDALPRVGGTRSRRPWRHPLVLRGAGRRGRGVRRCLVGDDAVDADLTSAWKRREMRAQQREMRAQRLPLDGSSWWRPSPDWIWRGLEEGGDDHGKSPREETEGGSGIVLLFRDGRCLLLLNAGPNQSSQHPYDVCGFLFFSLPHVGAALRCFF